MDTKSISKGAFAFKGKGKKFKADDYIFNNDEKNRLTIYNILSEKANDKIKMLQKKLNDKVFDEIELFINSMFSLYKQNVNKNANISEFNLTLPTAILINGVNTPDHDVLFHNLCERFNANVTPHVARLHSDKCKDIKSAIKTLISQLVYNTNEIICDDTDDEVIPAPSFITTKCLPTFRVISDWYASIYKDYCKDILTPQKNIHSHLSNKKDNDMKSLKYPTDIRTKILSIELENINIDDFSPPRGLHNVGEKFVTSKKKANSIISKKDNGVNKFDKNPLISESNYINLYEHDNISSANGDELNRAENKYAYIKNGIKPIVIIIEDFYSFNTAVIHDFFIICCEYLDCLPIILIVGTATNINSLHSILPHSVTSRLNIQQFQTPFASLQLSSVLDQILFKEDLLFKLDYKVFSFLLDFFLFYDFSIHSFLRGYNYAMLQHFQFNPASIICVDFLELEYVVSNLNKNQIKFLKALPSFKNYYENSTPQIQDMFKDCQFIKTQIIEFIKKIKDYNRNMIVILKCLHQFATVIPDCSLGKQFREIYAFVLFDDIGKSEDYHNTIKSIRLFSTSELLKNLVICKDILKSSNQINLEFQDFYNSIEKFIIDLENLSVSKDEELNNEFVNEEIKNKITRKISIHALRELLIENDPKKKKVPTATLR